MPTDTLGDCPLCGHVESSDDDWTFEGFSTVSGVDHLVRTFRCRACGQLVTPDIRPHLALRVECDYPTPRWSTPPS